MSQMFYESLKQIVEAGGETLQDRQFDAMERWAIDWILLADRDHTMHDYKDLKDAVSASTRNALTVFPVAACENLISLSFTF